MLAAISRYAPSNFKTPAFPLRKAASQVATSAYDNKILI